jgi:hypothetical protein
MRKFRCPLYETGIASTRQFTNFRFSPDSSKGSNRVTIRALGFPDACSYVGTFKIRYPPTSTKIISGAQAAIAAGSRL